ncbi:MAG: C40 family peptidase [Propionibacteriaceae bacterium]|jgi:cell wall-associated NlpC family hydrolase|nr:C40 family peptidase [Propionibacteriaceae bacterium]
MMTRLHRPIAVVIAAFLVVSLGWLAPAQADELSDAKETLEKLQGEASQANEDYNAVKERLDAAEARLVQIKSDLEAQVIRVAELREQAVVVTLQQFQDRGVAATVVLLSSSSQDEMINRLTVSSQVANTTQTLLAAYTLGQSSLAELRIEQDNQIALIEAEKARMAELKEAAAAKVAEAERLVARLTAAQQAGLGGAWAWNSDVYGPPPPVQNGAAAQAVVNYVMSKVGQPYVWGGEGPWGYDCSGLTMMAYRAVGIGLPHGSMSQFRYGVPVPKSDLQPGDLVFFYSGPGHVGIYVGGGMIVDARNESVGIVYAPLEGGMSYVGARRLL